MSDETTPLLSEERNRTAHKNVQEEWDSQVAEHDPSAGPSAAESPLPEDKDPGKSFAALATTIMPMAVGTFLASMDYTIVASSFAAIGSDLKQLQNTSWIATGYMLTSTSFQPLYGKLSDIFGRKPCLLFAYSIFALGCLFCGLARNMNELIAARALAGIGGGGMSTIVSIIMSDIIPLRSRGTWQGIINIVWASGSACGAPLGGLLADSIGWRWAFLFQVPISVLAFTSVSIALKLPKPVAADFKARLKRIDFAGSLTLVLAVSCLLLGLDRGGNVAWDDKFTVGALAAAAVLSALFGLVETRLAREPFAPSRIALNPMLLASYLCNFFSVASSMSLVFYVALYVQAVRLGSAKDSGLVLLPSIVGGVTGSLGSGLIMQATGKYHVLTVTNYFIMVGGIALVTLVTAIIAYSLPVLEIGLTLMSIGNGSGITTTLIALIAHAGPADQAVATAVSYLFRSLGSVVGLAVSSTLFQDTLRRYLRSRLEGQDVEEIVSRVRESLTYIDTLDPAVRAVVRTSYEQSIHSVFFFSLGLAVCALVSSFFIREKPLARS
ncbi:MFS general substrate transporter [Dentipellis sp. KUC8613]|nr:MFS general substrate transporter [Dentipellis sp. KUC8613]